MIKIENNKILVSNKFLSYFWNLKIRQIQNIQKQGLKPLYKDSKNKNWFDLKTAILWRGCK